MEFSLKQFLFNVQFILASNSCWLILCFIVRKYQFILEANFTLTIIHCFSLFNFSLIYEGLNLFVRCMSWLKLLILMVINWEWCVYRVIVIVKLVTIFLQLFVLFILELNIAGGPFGILYEERNWIMWVVLCVICSVSCSWDVWVIRL